MLFILKTYFHYFLSSYFTIVKEHFMFENADEIKDNIFIFVYLYAFLRNLLQKCEQKNSLINKSKKITYNLLSLILNDMINFFTVFPSTTILPELVYHVQVVSTIFYLHLNIDTRFITIMSQNM